MSMKRFCAVAACLLLITATLWTTRESAGQAAAEGELVLRPGDHIAIIGNTLAERMQQFGYFEALLHNRFPKHELVVRNLAWSADEVTLQPRPLDFGSLDTHLTEHKADVIFACYGFNESFKGPAGLPGFEQDLAAFIQARLAQRYNGKSAPQFVLVSPIAFENLGGDLPAGKQQNANLKLYTAAMAKVARAQKVRFLDLFTPTAQLMPAAPEKLTFNGIHLTDSGYKRLAPVLQQALFGESRDSLDSPKLKELTAAVNEKSLQFWYRYRAVNGFYIYGGRKNPFGTVSFPQEMTKLDQMVENRDRRIWRIAQGLDVPEKIDDSNTVKLDLIPTNYTRPINILPPEEARKAFTAAPGYEVNLFASEQEFPILENPVAMAWDARGRLWVCTMPSYPQYLPGVPVHDKLIILEDTNHDGKADKSTVFADGLHVPTGFELGDGGVYIAQQPNLVFLKDTDGDDKADVRETILHGFGTEDSHHSISAFTWSPGGELYFEEGTFHHSQIETPYGPERLVDAGVFRYEPRTQRVEGFVSYGFANPWGHIFDRWGQNFVADASGGSNYFGTAFSGYLDYPRKHSRLKEFTLTKVRPTAGCEFVSSRQFPDSAQGNFLLNNCIGFQGIKQYKVTDEGSGFVGTEIEPLLQSSDPNFRPVDIEFGPDGALYIVDWYNPLVGHMQHSLRDPNRDKTHGRIWRISYKDRPTVERPQIAGQPIPVLLDLLKSYEDRTRYIARLELRERKTDDVLAALEKWTAGLDKRDPDYEHQMLEALWVHQHHHRANPKLLARMLKSPDPRARAAATRVLCYQRHLLEKPLDLLRVQAHDEHPRVRLEAVRACSFFREPAAAEVALELLKHPLDYYLEYTLKETMNQLEQFWKPSVSSGAAFAADNPAGINYIIGSIATPDLLKLTRTEPVHVALLSRPSVEEAVRIESLRALAKTKQTDELTELIGAIKYVDQQQTVDIGTMSDLAQIFTTREPAALRKARQQFEELATRGRQPITRQIGFVTMLTADGAVDATWKMAARSVPTLRDLLDAIPLIPDAKLRGALYEKIEPLLHGLPSELAAQLGTVKTANGRFVRIEIPGKEKTLTLAEVEVMSGGANVAVRGKASQSSTAFNAAAQRAIDGNSAGEFSRNTQTHTETGTNPWWEVDLGAEYPIDSIVVYNRSELNGQYAGRLEGFKLTVLDSNRQPVFTQANNPAPPRSAAIALESNPTGLIRRAAINAVTYLEGHETESFFTLSKFVQEGDERQAAVVALHRLPKNKWPRDAVRPLVDSLVNYAQKVPATDRVLPEVQDALQLGNDLASLLPADQAKKVRAAIGDLGVQTILIRAVPHAMLYDKRVIAVEAGKPVQIVFDNVDIMPHNLVITTPGSMADVGLAAERMATQSDAAAKNFVPSLPQVLFSTRLLQSRETEKLAFVAPMQPGEYSYVCTYPGHWRRMYGTMQVVENLEEYLAKNPLPDSVPELSIRPFVKDWKLADLQAALAKTERGRSFDNGKKVFTAAACINCHRMNEIGGAIGPDLAQWDPKLSPADILSEMLEPSKRINEKFQAWVVVTDEGKQYIGRILSEDKKSIRLMPNPIGLEKCEPTEIPIASIEFRQPSKTSMMPNGLLNTLTEAEILDLLAYIRARGKPDHAAYQE
jgi:putative heme-binding domain-containing protein